MSTRIHSALLVFALLFAGCASPTNTTQQDTLVLVNGTLIDGTGADPVPNAVLVIQGEQIIAVGSKEEIEIPRGAKVIDVQGATILPGFINAHVHYAMFDAQNLKAWAQGGVTTVRDEAILSSRKPEELIKLRDKARNDPQFARLITAGYMMTVEGGYGILYVSSPEDARQKVFEELDAGADLIKISMEDGYAGRSGLPKLTDEEITAIISAAHERGKLVSGHMTQAEYLEILVKAGVDDIAHVAYDPVPDDVWQEMVAKDIYMTPTFSVLHNYGAPIATCVFNLHNFLAHGGQVALGNDYGGGPGEFELGIPMYEIEQMSAAGMTPMQIIVASTKNAAIVSGIDDQVGTLETGKIADVLVVSGDPLDDLQSLINIRMVIHNGTIIRNEDGEKE
ncbi:MAG TPA: amidohydrolase family protein [Anaerolineales bacterium]|nr:amidohydrolase family protein [Anaerolineales bacterium]